MDPRLLQAYNDELVHLRETARRFGEEYPTVAGRLGLSAAADVDPHVERLLEGVAFLGARVQLKLRDQFPDFTQHLLNVIQPHYLAPTPSICIVGFEPREGDGALTSGVEIPRETQVHSVAADRDATPVIFRTGHKVTLLPIRVDEVEYLGSRTAVAPYLGAWSGPDTIEAGLRIRLRSTGGTKLAAIAIDSLPIYLDGAGAVPGELYRQLIGDAVSASLVAVGVTAASQGARLTLPEQHGFAEECALFPAEPRSSRGYRILGEYFACAERFQFVRLTGLSAAFAALGDADACDIVILFRRCVPSLSGAISSANFRLFATPAINLFEKQLDRVQIDAFDHERQVMADRARPLDFEVYRLLDVKAHGREATEVRQVAPLYDYAGQLHDWGDALFFVTRMRHRRLSTREQRVRRRDDYIGTETWISLTAPGRPERLEEIAELSVRALVTNRELAGMIGTNAPFVAEGVPVRAISLLRAPTKPRPPLGIGDAAWRVIGHLTPNYTGFARDPGGSPEILRNHLALYGRVDDPALRREVDGVRAIHSSSVSRRVPDRTRPAFVRGTHLRILLDEANYENGRIFLFSAVVERFLAEFAGINSFTEISFESLQQGVFVQWPPRLGQRPTI